MATRGETIGRREGLGGSKLLNRTKTTGVMALFDLVLRIFSAYSEISQQMREETPHFS